MTSEPFYTPSNSNHKCCQSEKSDFLINYPMEAVTGNNLKGTLEYSNVTSIARQFILSQKSPTNHDANGNLLYQPLMVKVILLDQYN